MHAEPDGLFDLPTTTPAATPSAAPAEARPTGGYVPTNDMDLIEAILARASEPGYVLRGVNNGAEQVWRRRIRRGEHVEPIPTSEADAVRQLLDQGFLIRGGGNRIRYHGREAHATSVLVTQAARTRLRRWRSYTRPASWNQDHTAA